VACLLHRSGHVQIQVQATNQAILVMPREGNQSCPKGLFGCLDKGRSGSTDAWMPVLDHGPGLARAGKTDLESVFAGPGWSGRSTCMRVRGRMHQEGGKQANQSAEAACGRVNATRTKQLTLHATSLTLHGPVQPIEFWLWLKILFWLNYCERKTLTRLKKEVEQVEYGVSRTGPLATTPKI